MKKALQISIAKTLFTIEEDAYVVLDSYLKSIAEHFKDTKEKEEIVADIENRVAEQILESKEKIVTLGSVNKIIALIGRVQDFDDKENITKEKGTTFNSSSEKTEGKRLYRDTEDVVIAGVASGLATHFNIDAVWVRLAFVLLTFANGFGILAYIILWIVIPEAKTTSQKFAMKGSPFTLETLSKRVRAGVEAQVHELKEDKKGIFRKIISFPFKVLGAIIRFISKTLFPIVRVFTGIILSFGAIVALMAIMIAAGFVASGTFMIIPGVPLQALLPPALQALAIVSGALVFMIPLIFLLLLAFWILSKKTSISTPIALGLLILWFSALFVSGLGAAKIIANYENTVGKTPAYQETTLTIPIEGDFDSLEIKHGIDITLIQNTSTSLTASGRMRDIDTVKASVQNGTLVIEPNRSREEWCLFCSFGNPDLTLSVPSLSKATARYGSSIESSLFPASKNLSLLLEYGSYGSFPVSLNSLKAELSQGSSLTLKGDVKDLDMTLEYGSKLRGEYLKAVVAKISASEGAEATLTVTENLDASARYGGQINYFGKPTLTKEEKAGGSVQSFDEEITSEIYSTEGI